jgi:acyl-CoA thioesterase-1
MSRVVHIVFVLFLLGGGVFRMTAENALAQDSTKSGRETKVILCFGDSLTAGYGLEPSQAFPALIQEKIHTRGWKFRVVNAGLSGETTAGGLRRIDWVLQRPVDILVLELGANDGLRGLSTEKAKQNLQAIIDRTRSKYPQVKVVIAGMQVPSNLGREYTARFRAIFPELAKANNAALIPFLLEGVGSVPELNLPDGIHPTAAGQTIVAENVWKVLEPVLEEVQ